MKTLSLDLRERILAAYDAGNDTRESVATRFRVSVGMVKKLLQQRRRLGDLRPQHHRAGRKPKIQATDRLHLRQALAQKPDLTLAELRACTGLNCSLPAIHYVLSAMGLTFKKRRSVRPSRTDPMSVAPASAGSAPREHSSRAGSSFSTSRRRRPT